MAETNSVPQDIPTVSHELQSLEIKSTSSAPGIDSPAFGSFNDSQDNFVARTTSDRTGDTHAGDSVRESRSSTPNSGTDYQSCSNPSTPERRPSERCASVVSISEVVANVKMSANVATKLNQLRVSMENLDTVSQISCEDAEVLEPTAGLPHQDSSAVGDSPGTGRRTSLKPSLRQVFPYISCLPFENNIVFCCVLSVWDNIVGPQTVYVWKRKSFPSQKTFDGLLDERDGIEMGEESTESVRTGCRSRRMSQHGEAQENTSYSSRESIGNDQRRNERCRTRKMSTSSRHSENDSPIHTDKHAPYHSGSQGTLTKKDLTLNCINKQNSVSKERKSESVSIDNCSDEDVVAQIDVQTGSEGSSEKLTPKMSNSCEEEGGAGDASKRRRAPSLRNSSLASVDHTSLDIDGQEFAGSWACGRSRLRMAAVVRYVTEHSVAVGQVGMSSEKITTSLLVVPHQGIIIVAARFTVLEDECGVPYCLSMVVPLDEYDYFLPLTQPVTTWLVTIAASTRLLITKHGLEGGGLVRSKLVELCDVLVALRSASLDQYPLLPAGRPPDDRRLAEIILTSHLQTLGSTVVVADSPNAANKVVMWIAQFSDPSDLHVSRLCLSYTQWPFHPGLSIQGIVRSANGEVNLSAQKLIQSSRPLTVVDINRGTVKQTGAPDVHARRNSSALHQELLSLWHDLPDVSAPSESLLEPVRGAAPLVKRFLHDYDRLSSCENSVRQNFIKAFLRSLKYSALAIITWTQQEWSVQRRRSGYGSLRRALCSVFDYDDSDLRIILAQAELLQPGFYTYVMM